MSAELALSSAALVQLASIVQNFRQQKHLSAPSDIRGPAIVYATYSACGNNDIHNFDTIRALAQRGARVYAISLTPSPDVLSGQITYIDRTKPSKGATFTVMQSPGIPVFADDEAQAARVANRFGIAVNPNQLNSHSNRLVFIDAQNHIVGSIPSTRPLNEIMGKFPQFFAHPAKAASAQR